MSYVPEVWDIPEFDRWIERRVLSEVPDTSDWSDEQVSFADLWCHAPYVGLSVMDPHATEELMDIALCEWIGHDIEVVAHSGESGSEDHACSRCGHHERLYF